LGRWSSRFNHEPTPSIRLTQNHAGVRGRSDSRHVPGAGIHSRDFDHDPLHCQKIYFVNAFNVKAPGLVLEAARDGCFDFSRQVNGGFTTGTGAG
jgi:hypothetical protein